MQRLTNEERNEADRLWRMWRADAVSIANTFRRRYGGDVDEHVSEACWALVWCIGQHGVAWTETHPWWWRRTVYGRLYDRYRNETGRRRRCKPQQLDFEPVYETKEDRILEILQDLPYDARVVAVTLLYPPAECGHQIVRVSEYFVRVLGWQRVRVTRAFGALRSLLQCA